MIEFIDKLTRDEKLFMIHNKNCFSLPTVSSINFNEDKWKKDIEINIHPDIIKRMIDDTNSINSIQTIARVGRYPGDGLTETQIRSVLKTLINMPTETIENVKDTLSVFGTIFKIINESGRTSISDMYVKGIVKYFFSVLLPWKLRAHEIWVNTCNDCIPNDDYLKEFYRKTVRLVLQEMTEGKSSYGKMAIHIYQLCKYLNIDNESHLKHVLVLSMNKLHGYDYSELNSLVRSLLKETVDSLNIIDSLSDTINTKMSEVIVSDARRTIETNYQKNIISDKIRNDGVCIGDNVFDNGVISLSKLLMELDMLSEDRLKDYIGENKMTSFSIPENDIGYLKLREQLPICKVMTKDSNFYTLTRYEDKSYLLFKISGDSKCYGISFPSIYGGGRQVVVFDIPTNYEYMMTMK